jgi:hypothetical protein
MGRAEARRHARQRRFETLVHFDRRIEHRRIGQLETHRLVSLRVCGSTGFLPSFPRKRESMFVGMHERDQEGIPLVRG